MTDESLKWRANVPGLFGEILNNNKGLGILTQPLNITLQILRKVAERAIELDDTELNKLMLRLSLYSIADPKSDDFNQSKVIEYLKK